MSVTQWDKNQAASWLCCFGKVYEDSGREGYEITLAAVAEFVASVREQLAERLDREVDWEKRHGTSETLVRGIETSARELRREPRLATQPESAE